MFDCHHCYHHSHPHTQPPHHNDNHQPHICHDIHVRVPLQPYTPYTALYTHLNQILILLLCAVLKHPPPNLESMSTMQDVTITM